MSAIGLPMPGHVELHLGDQRGRIPDLCWCPCDKCTARLTLACLCLDCPCDGNADHVGTQKEQGWI